jgi:hypothetical protein
MFRDQCQASPDEQMLAAGLVHAPDGSGAMLAAVLAAHCGSLEDGQASVRPIKTFGAPVLDAMGPIPYCDQNGLLDASMPRGAFNYWKSQFLTDLTDDAIRMLVEAYASVPSPMCQIVIEHFHGAASRIPVEATACAMRTTGFNVVLVAQWADRSLDERCTAWCRDSYAALKPYLRPLRYVNYLGADEVDDPMASLYGPNYARLRKLKQRYDPDNFFHINVNISPGS